MHDTLSETQARHQIAERVARAAAPRLSRITPRQRLARSARRLADRLED